MLKHIRISIMLDNYGCLLTPKQKDIMELYYNNDFSLSEIAEGTKTSRQAIYDLIKRCEKQLDEYENKLKLVEKYFESDKIKKEMLQMINHMRDEKITQKDKESILTKLEDMINEKF